MTMFQSLVREGIASGEMIEADWMQIDAGGARRQCFLFSERAGVAA